MLLHAGKKGEDVVRKEHSALMRLWRQDRKSMKQKDTDTQFRFWPIPSEAALLKSADSNVSFETFSSLGVCSIPTSFLPETVFHGVVLFCFF